MFVESKGSSSELASMNQQHQCLFVQLDQNLASQLKGPFIWNPIFRWNTSYEKCFSKNPMKTFTKTGNVTYFAKDSLEGRGESGRSIRLLDDKNSFRTPKGHECAPTFSLDDLRVLITHHSSLINQSINQSINACGPMTTKTIYVGINAQKHLVA